MGTHDATPAPVVDAIHGDPGISRAPLVGREREIEATVSLLRQPETHLIVLTGTGGVGKTRLGIEVAAQVAMEFADGTVFVPLAPVTSPDSIIPAIARATGLVFGRGQDLKRQLVDHLRERRMLLVLDNFEHLMEGVALLTELLAQLPTLRILVTSRERLRVIEERMVVVEGLDYPDRDYSSDPELYPAVRLFLDSARRADEHFSLPADELPWVLRLCRLVEGLPLAIELAASWVKVLSCREIVQELETNPESLATRMRDVPKRHQTIRVVFDHSWGLLPDEEQEVLQSLSVFRGTFGRQAASQVAGAQVTHLADLVDRSLLRAYSSPDGRRNYDLHELIRQCAYEHLEADRKATSTRDRHLAFFTKLAEEADPHLVLAQQDVWFKKLEAEHDNLRAALQWAIESRQGEFGLRLVGALWWFWWVRGHASEGRRWLEAALAVDAIPATSTSAKAMHGAGWLAVHQHDYERASLLLEQSLALAQEVGDAERLVIVLRDLGQSARLQGKHLRAMALFEQSVALSRQLGALPTAATSLVSSGMTLQTMGNDLSAKSVLEEGLTILRESGDKVYMAWTLNFLGRVENSLRDPGKAAACLDEALALFGDVLDHDGMAYTLESFAGLAVTLSNGPCATRLLGAADALREAIGSPMAPSDRPEHERYVRAARSLLDPVTFTSLWADGRETALGDAIQLTYTISSAMRAPAEPDLNLSEHQTPVASDESLPADLTPREAEVLRLIAFGLSNQQIADEFVLSVRTVERHIANIYGKIGVSGKVGRAAAAAYAVEHHLAIPYPT